MKLYEQLADEIRRAIRGGVYAAGGKLPSIRDISKSKRVSVNTVQKAYSHLEQRGQILARARTGYFVQQAHNRVPPEAELGEPWSGEFVDLMPSLLAHTAHPNVLNLGLAQPEADVTPYDLIAKTMRSVLRHNGGEIFGYCDPAGVSELRQQIAKMMSAVGLRANVSDLIVTNGGQEAIFIALRILTRRGDVVAVESPCYCGTLQILSSLGLRILEIPSFPGHGIRQDLLAVAAKKYRIAACYVMTAVSNPCGGSMTQSDKESLCVLADRLGFPIIEDFVNAELANTEEGRRPLKSYDKANNVLMCSSFSKSLSPGLRTGWIVAGPHQAQALKLKYGSSLGVSPLNQLSVARLISAGHFRRHVVKARRVHAQTLRILRDTVEAYFPEGTTISRPSGGFCLWVQLPDGYDTKQISQMCFEAGVAFAPGYIFSVNREMQNFLRISWGGTWTERITSGVQTVASMIRKAR